MSVLDFLLDFAYRAWESSVQAMGTTTLALIISFLAIPLLVLFLEWAGKGFTREGWSVVAEHARTNLIVSTVTALIWLAVFFYHCGVVRNGIYQDSGKIQAPRLEERLPSPPPFAIEAVRHTVHRFTAKELASFGRGVAIQLGEEVLTLPGKPPEFIPVAVGFWASSKGYVVTCLHPIPMQQKFLVAAVPMPPLLGQHIIIPGGGMYTGAELIDKDDDGDLALLRVFNSPFERTMHMGAFFKSLKTGEVESQSEEYWVPQIASNLAESGDEVVRIGFASEAMPVISPDFGHIIRAGVDVSKKASPLRLYTSLPFKTTDCGGPLINEKKQIVGLIIGPDPTSTFMEPRGLAVPSRYIRALLKRAKIAE
jgi:hypothetical protein